MQLENYFCAIVVHYDPAAVALCNFPLVVSRDAFPLSRVVHNNFILFRVC